MDLRALSDQHFVAHQLEVSDMATLAEQGFSTIICNRPDSEVPPTMQAAQLQAAAEKAGMEFIFNPVNGAAMTLDNVEEQAEAFAAAEGPILAYCASGMRSAVMWALAEAGHMPTDDIIGTCETAGYPIAGMRGQIDALGTRKG